MRCLHIGGSENATIIKLSTLRNRTPTKGECRAKIGEVLRSEVLWSVGLNGGGMFAGRIKQVVVNDEGMDVEHFLADHTKGGPPCHPSAASSCSSSPCLNGGLCIQHVHIWTCNCQQTSYHGDVCHLASPSIKMHANGRATFDLESNFRSDRADDVTIQSRAKIKIEQRRQPIRSQAENLSFRFQILKKSYKKLDQKFRLPSFGQHLLTVYSANFNDFIQIVVINSTLIQVATLIGDDFQLMYVGMDSGTDVGDGRWHSLKMGRRGWQVGVVVDDRVEEKGILKALLDGTQMKKSEDKRKNKLTNGDEEHITVPTNHDREHDTSPTARQWIGLHVGQMPRSLRDNISISIKAHINKQSFNQSTARLHPSIAYVEPETGANVRLQQMNWNNRMLLRTGNLEKMKMLVDGSAYDARFEIHHGNLLNPFTISSQVAHLQARLSVRKNLAIYMQVRTSKEEGLLLYIQPTKGSLWLALEFVGGQLRCLFDAGGIMRSLKTDLHQPLNDQRWHQVALIFRPNQEMIMKVDNITLTESLYHHFYTSSSSSSRRQHFHQLPGNQEFQDELTIYLGGTPPMPPNTLMKLTQAHSGFAGCLASVELVTSDVIYNLQELGYHVQPHHSNSITQGCQEPSSGCADVSCLNGGECVHEWNSYSCNCDYTSFTGPSCDDDAVSYSFGGEGGVMLIEFSESERGDSIQDTLSFGFITNQRQDAILFRVSSGNSNDHLQVELVAGNVMAVYNLGTMDHPVSDTTTVVNDNLYHVVRLRRSEANATLQVDDKPPVWKTPSGHQLTSINNQAFVSIGGKKEIIGGRTLKPFRGVLSGLVFNGQQLLTLAADQDGRVRITGNVQLYNKPLRPYISKTTSKSQKVTQSFSKSPCHPPNDCPVSAGNSSVRNEARSPGEKDIQSIQGKNHVDTSHQLPSSCFESIHLNHSASKECSRLSLKFSSQQHLETTSPLPLWQASQSTNQIQRFPQTPTDESFPNFSRKEVSGGLQSPHPVSSTSSIQQQLRHAPSSLPSEERKLLNLFTSTEPQQGLGKEDAAKSWSPDLRVGDKSDTSSLKLLGIVIGVVSASVIMFTGLLYTLHRYRRRNQGTYRIDGMRFSASYETASSSLTVNNLTSNNTKPLVHLKSASSTPIGRKGSRHSKSKTPLTSREWYV